MPGVSTPQISMPRILRGPGDRGVVVNSALQPMKASGHGMDLCPGAFIKYDAGLETYASADVSAAYVVKNIYDQYGNLRPFQYIADGLIAATDHVSVMNIGGIEFECTEDAAGSSGTPVIPIPDDDIGKHATLIVVARATAGAASQIDNPIGTQFLDALELDSSVTRTASATSTTIWLLAGLADGADNPGWVAADSGVKRNWRIKCGNATYSQ